MNKSIGVQLVVYGLLSAGLSYFAYHLVPALAQPTLVAGLAGGTLCLVWGIRAVFGSIGKALPVLTLIAVNFVLLAQVITGWMGGGEANQGRLSAAAVITVVFGLSMGMLMRIAWAGAVDESQAGSRPKDGAPKPQTSGRTASQANAGKRASGASHE